MQKQEYIQKKMIIQRLDWEKVTLFSLYCLSVLIPLVIGKPQLLVGSTINFLLTFSTLKYGIKRTVPLLVLPSLTAYLTGLLFGGATLFLLYLIPFISLSNLVYTFFISKKKYHSYLFAILTKGGFLLLIYFLLNRVTGLPSIFISSSYLQFVTATIGLMLGIGLYRISK